MATLAIQKTEWDSLAPEQQEGVRMSASLPRLGEPAEYVDETDTVWYIFDDHRITEDQVAMVAALMENPASIPLPLVTEDEETV